MAIDDQQFGEMPDPKPEQPMASPEAHPMALGPDVLEGLFSSIVEKQLKKYEARKGKGQVPSVQPGATSSEAGPFGEAVAAPKATMEQQSEGLRIDGRLENSKKMQKLFESKDFRKEIYVGELERRHAKALELVDQQEAALATLRLQLQSLLVTVEELRKNIPLANPEPRPTT